VPTSNSLNDGQPTVVDERATVTRAAHVLAAMTALSRVSGLVRDMTVSAFFGTGLAAEAFFVAFRLPNLFRRIAAEGAASAAFVPVFTESLARGGPGAAVVAAAAVGGVTMVALLALTVAGMAAAEPMTDLFAPGFAADPDKRARTISLTFWTFPYLLMVGTAAWSMGVLHTFRSFAVPALGPVLLNASIIACAFLLVPSLEQGEYALVAGVLIGGALQVAVQAPSLWRLGMRPRMFASPGHLAVRRTGPLLVAAVFGGAVYQINVLIATIFASLLPAGAVSYLWYADRVFEFPLGIVAVAVGTAALPSLAGHASAGRRDGLRSTVVHALTLTTAYCLPAAAGLLLLAPDIVELLLERGRFSSQDTMMTAWALKAQVPGLLGVALVRVLSSAFYAIGRPRVPVYAAVVALIANLVVSLALMGPPAVTSDWWAGRWMEVATQILGVADLRHAGLAMATGIAATLNALILLVALQVRLRGLPLTTMMRSLALQCLAAAMMTAAVAAALSTLAAMDAPAGARVGIGLAVGVAVYLAAGAMLGSREIVETLAWLRSRIRPSS